MAVFKREYHDSGKLKSEWFEINEKKEGEFKMYYPDGKLWKRCIFINGELE
jgi:antitoxin component YwqK of YwqJK toxin-antitoxin module